MGGPDILGLVKGFFPQVSCSTEFVNVGGWLTFWGFGIGFFVLSFWLIAEHRLIPSWARSVCHQLRRAGHHSVWSPACQDQVAGGHAGVGVR